MTVNIIYYSVNKNNVATINNILTQISNKNIKFNVRLIIKPNSGVKELLNNLKEKDERFDYTYISSFDFEDPNILYLCNIKNEMISINKIICHSK